MEAPVELSFAAHLTAEQRQWLAATRIPLRSLSFGRLDLGGEDGWDPASVALLTDSDLLRTSETTLQVRCPQIGAIEAGRSKGILQMSTEY